MVWLVADLHLSAFRARGARTSSRLRTVEHRRRECRQLRRDVVQPRIIAARGRKSLTGSCRKRSDCERNRVGRRRVGSPLMHHPKSTLHNLRAVAAFAGIALLASCAPLPGRNMLGTGGTTTTGSAGTGNAAGTSGNAGTGGAAAAGHAGTMSTGGVSATGGSATGTAGTGAAGTGVAGSTMGGGGTGGAAGT